MIQNFYLFKEKIENRFSPYIPEYFFLFFIFNTFLALITFFYINLRISELNDLIPFWYTKPWGDLQLANKYYIYLIPFFISFFTLVSAFLSSKIKQMHLRYGGGALNALATTTNVLLVYSLAYIVQYSIKQTPPLINPLYVTMTIGFVFSLITAYLITPAFITLYESINLVTNPYTHKHPGMILVSPSTRGGGLVFILTVIFAGIFFIDFTPQIIGILTAALLVAIFGILDDYQNTNPSTKIRFLENPALRLICLFAISYILVLYEIKINFIGNPFDGLIYFGDFLSIFITLVWVVWVLNVLSWANGIDGQYSGIVGIVGIVICLLALRFSNIDHTNINFAKFALIMAGASFGLGYYNWYPSKIMWGFGAMSAGIIIASLSILVGGKIATSVLIILIPFLDGIISVIRRTLNKQNPLRGDRFHLHHLLMRRGWGVRRIATFYWGTTAFFGLIAVLSSDKEFPLFTLTIIGLVGFCIAALNVVIISKQKLKDN